MTRDPPPGGGGAAASAAATGDTNDATPGMASMAGSTFKKLFVDTPGSTGTGSPATGEHKVQTELLLDDIRAVLNEKIDGE